MTNFCRIHKHFSAYRNTANTYFAFNDANLDELFLKKLKPLRDVFLDIMKRRYQRKKKCFKDNQLIFEDIWIKNYHNVWYKITIGFQVCYQDWILILQIDLSKRLVRITIVFIFWRVCSSVFYFFSPPKPSTYTDILRLTFRLLKLIVDPLAKSFQSQFFRIKLLSQKCLKLKILKYF